MNRKEENFKDKLQVMCWKIITHVLQWILCIFSGIFIGLGIGCVFIILCILIIICCKRHIEKRHHRIPVPNRPNYSANEKHEMKIISTSSKPYKVSPYNSLHSLLIYSYFWQYLGAYVYTSDWGPLHQWKCNLVRHNVSASNANYKN